MRLDFYLPKHNIAIECQGKQHYEPIDFSGRGEKWAMKEFLKIQERDKRKLTLCALNHTQLIYINNNEEIIEKLKEIV